MTTATIAAIYDAIKHCNGEYCSICFSPASERKLVTPTYIVQLRFSMKYAKINALKNRPLKVCYICEAMAARAVRFQKVVTLANSVEAMLTWMTDELRDALVQQEFLPNKYITQEMTHAVLQVKEVEEALQNTVMPQLSCSHVLHVGSDTPNILATDFFKLQCTNPGGTGPRGTGPRGASPGGTRVRNNEPILVEDIPPPPGLVQASTVPGILQLQVRETTTGNVVLHPIIIGNNEKMYVPSLKVEVINNELLKSVTDDELFTYANIPKPPPPPPPLKPVPKKTSDAQTETNKNSTMIETYYDFIKKQTEIKKNEKNKDPLELDEDVDDGVLNKKPRLKDSNKDDSNGMKDGVWEVIKPVKTYAMKKPVMQMHKVLDWEDKIPMDIISFVDATDPNPNERIMQPNRPITPKSPTMGVISDVRTVDDNDSNGFDNNEVSNSENEDADNDVVLVENIECIDLC